MKRYFVGFLSAVLACGLVAGSAAADKKKKKGGAKTAAAAPMSAKIAESMADLKWGISRDDLLKKFTDQIREKYRPLIAKTKDSVEEDRLRQEARQALDAIKKSAVDFDGRKSNWDVSFLKGEFTQGNDESMLVVKDENSQNYYFFIGGKLWKWYKAFDAAVFPAGDFGTFASAVQRRFGKAKTNQGELRPGEGTRNWLEWQDKSTRLKAVDQSAFYGFFCLVFEDKGTLDSLARLRSNTPEEGQKGHALVDAVTSGRTEEPDDAPNIADRLTGKIRQSEQAPEQGASSSDDQASTRKPKPKSKGKPTPEPSAVRDGDDPLSGLGL